MLFFSNRTKRFTTQEATGTDPADGVPPIDAVIAEAMATTTGEVSRPSPVASSYVKLRDWRMHVVGLRDRTKQAQEGLTPEPSTFQDIERVREGLDLRI